MFCLCKVIVNWPQLIPSASQNMVIPSDMSLLLIFHPVGRVNNISCRSVYSKTSPKIEFTNSGFVENFPGLSKKTSEKKKKIIVCSFGHIWGQGSDWEHFNPEILIWISYRIINYCSIAHQAWPQVRWQSNACSLKISLRPDCYLLLPTERSWDETSVIGGGGWTV